MIDKNNLQFCFDNLSEDEVEAVMNGPEDYVLMELHVFNSGAYPSVMVMGYNHDIEQEAAENGDLFLDKDAFITLFHESGSQNPAFQHWL